MASYTPPVEDMVFLLSEVFDFDGRMAELPGFEEINSELAATVLEEAGKFAAEVLEPLNRSLDISSRVSAATPQLAGLALRPLNPPPRS